MWATPWVVQGRWSGPVPLTLHGDQAWTGLSTDRHFHSLPWQAEEPSAGTAPAEQMYWP